MIQLIYGSSATRPMKNNELLEILEKARANNHKLGISGMLLYHDQNFMQVLEGEKEVIEPLFEKIVEDNRHYQVMVYVKKPITERSFGDWSMGYVKLSTADLERVEGLSDFMRKPLKELREDFSQKPSYATEFLLAFRSNAN